MTAFDWAIIAFVLLVMVGGVLASRSYMRGVADFLAAGRTGGRYLISVSQGIAGLGAITIVANLEMNFEAGFSQSWWGLSTGLVTLLIAVSGWVIYRFRETRCLTLAEFFERRYSRRFRVFAGVIAFFAGLINFGIFPAVGARFFIYFMGLPQTFEVLGLSCSTYACVMAVRLGIALAFVLVGGQVAVMVTDFVQGMFANIVFVVVSVYLLTVVGWTRIAEVLVDRPPGKSLVDPFDTGHIETFNFGYFLIGIIGVLYGAMSWQGTQAYNASARSAHEAKMGAVLAMWRGIPQGLVMLFVPIFALTVLRHPDWAGLAAGVDGTLTGVDGEAIRSQLRTPLVLAQLLPVGMIGAFAAVMLAAFVTTHDTYLHSWGSIFVQDIVLPLRGRPLRPEQHLLVLRMAIVGVAVFIYMFSLFYRQNEQILLFFAITGAIFAGGSGAVIIGGLYWSRGTTAAAWTAMITGSTIAVGGLILRDQRPDFPINGQQFWALGMALSALSYVVVSLLWKPQRFNLDRLLRRGAYAEREPNAATDPSTTRRWRWLGMGAEFTRGDRWLYCVTYAWTFGWTATFIIGTVVSLVREVPIDAWLRYWKIYLAIQVSFSLIVIAWFSIGGLRDLSRMLLDLAAARRDPDDDGVVRAVEAE